MTTTVKIAVERGGKVQPREDRVALWAQDGLAVTREPNERTYAVTHVASGYAVWKGLTTLRQARLAGERFLTCGDWTRSRTAITRDINLRARALSIRAELRSAA